ncbi:MAG TPA: DUF2726 domain-containing protein [Caulobacteraceae bacterium]
MSTEQLAQFLGLAAMVAFVVGVNLMRSGGRRRPRPHPRRWPTNVQSLGRSAPDPAPFDAAGQLRIVAGADFEKRRLLSKAEAQFFAAAEKAIAERGLTWRVMAQVCLGEVLSSPDPEAYRAINSKRVDILIVTRGGEPVAAIEYQGAGHYKGSAPMRDAVKKEALRRAGVRYIEVTPEHGPEDVAREIGRLVEPPRAASA